MAYARVSTAEDARQHQKYGLGVQTSSLEHCDYLFQERHSGSDDNRPEFNKAIELAKKLSKGGHDVSLVVYKMDRLARKTSTLLRTIEELKEHKVEFISIKENIDTSTPSGILFYQMISVFSEYELNSLKMRTIEGLQRAKAQGKKLGNQGLPEKIEANIVRLYQLNELPVKEIAKKCKVSETTVYNVSRRNNLNRRNSVKKPTIHN
ncbi:recombinase family protein [uncultured Vagococcus sp.]|uniref:recombinase family protein n=1 Tax=uncultured Vagococcus sp. TaxID=189676 RepID=UPI0028D09697|nr:recombinase family protein [uncultured Vagococcus sp.]